MCRRMWAQYRLKLQGAFNEKMRFSVCFKAQMDGIQWGKEVMPGVQHPLKCSHRKVENTVRRLLL